MMRKPQKFLGGPILKINSSHVNLTSTREYYSREEMRKSREIRFSDLMDQRLENLTPQAGFRSVQPGFREGWFSPTQFKGLPAVEMSQSFIAELEKLRQILWAIVDRLNSSAFNGCCLDMANLGMITIQSFQTPAPRFYEYELIETTQYSFEEQEDTSFFADGQVKTADGRSIDFSFEMNLNRENFYMDRFERKEKGYVMIDPLVINLSTTTPQVSDTKIDFDLNGDGSPEQIPILKQGSGFLCLDKNGDGIINDGTELFGPATGDGFEELSEYDSDQNWWIDENDPIFDELTLWEGDDEGQMHLTRIKDAGIGAIYLADVASQFDLEDDTGDPAARIKKSGIALNEDGSVSSVQEIDWMV